MSLAGPKCQRLPACPMQHCLAVALKTWRRPAAGTGATQEALLLLQAWLSHKGLGSKRLGMDRGDDAEQSDAD